MTLQPGVQESGSTFTCQPSSDCAAATVAQREFRASEPVDARQQPVSPLQRVAGFAVDPHLPVQVRTGRYAGAADLADDVSALNPGAHLGQDQALMVVAAGDAPSVVDHDGSAGQGQRLGQDDHPVVAGTDLGS